MSKTRQYKWIEKSSQFGFENCSNRKMLFIILRNRLGQDYVNWEKHPNFTSVCVEIHTKLFGLPSSSYKKAGGMTNQIRYLTGAFTYSEKHKCRNLAQRGIVGDAYRTAVKDAIESNVLDPKITLMTICESEGI